MYCQGQQGKYQQSETADAGRLCARDNFTMGRQVSVQRDASSTERRVFLRLESARLEANRRGISDGGERSETMRCRILVRLASARLSTSGGEMRGGGESGTIAATSEVVAPADGARGQRRRET